MTGSNADWVVEVRAATADDIKLCEAESKVSLVDGGAAVFVNAELVAVTDEYGTAHLRGGTDATPTADKVEELVAAVLDFYVAGNLRWEVSERQSGVARG